MNTKQWLNRCRKIDQEIDNLLRIKTDIKARLLNITQNYDSDGAQSTKDPHKYDRLAEIDSQIDEKIDQLAEVRQEIFQTIMKLDDSIYRQILTDRYIGGYTWERIAVHIHYSYKQTVRKHGHALRAIEKFIPKERCP